MEKKVGVALGISEQGTYVPGRKRERREKTDIALLSHTILEKRKKKRAQMINVKAWTTYFESKHGCRCN